MIDFIYHMQFDIWHFGCKSINILQNVCNFGTSIISSHYLIIKIRRPLVVYQF